MKSRAVVALAAAVLLLLGASVWSTVGATEAADDPARPSGWGHADPPGKGPDDAWKKLSPPQKADTMRRLSRQHADGMRAWAVCKAAGDDEAAGRDKAAGRSKAAGHDDCVRPTPPGHAKRR